MASIEEVRASIALATDKASESLGVLQQALSAVEEAQSLLQRATAGSGQSDVSEAVNMWSQAASNITDAQHSVSAGISAAEGVANRL